MTEKVFPADKNNLDDVLDFVSTEMEKADCSMKKIMQITVVMEEMFVNVADYAYPDEPGQVKISIEFDSGKTKMKIRMADHGIPFNPLDRKDPDITLSAEERQIGGLGIYMMKKTMDEVYYVYENGENILTMTKYIG
ncbi:MAG: ATP-binding protein [Clostridia bacterium]|nr:ATP-binding protein [Clostridia bacterium]MDY5555114.1 ATP-binding protein [Blautia sp.]